MGTNTTTVIATRNRREGLLRTLHQLITTDPDRPLIVVDNGSFDGTVARGASLYPQVTVIPLRGNLGATARNVGVRAARTTYVAFADDDSWWAPHSLAMA